MASRLAYSAGFMRHVKALFRPGDLSKVKRMTKPQPTAGGSVTDVAWRPRHWRVYAIALGLLLVHFGIAVGSKRVASTTSDELVHLTAGFSYWEDHDYRLQPENGILPQRWAAL